MDERDVLTEAEQASLAVVRTWRDQVNVTAGQYESPRINELLIQEMEKLKHAISARQLELTSHAVEAAKERLASHSNPAGLARRTTGLAVAFGRRRHPITGARLVHQALIVTQDMPEVLAAMWAGDLGETQAAILVRETEGLTGQQRGQVTEELRDRLTLLGDRGLGEAARAAAARIAPDEVASRHAKAVADRHVSMRSAPDEMLRLSALLPVRDGLACIQALEAAADAATSDKAPAAAANRLTGPPRQQWRQAQADALVARITGAEPGQTQTQVNVNLLVPIDALTGDAPAQLDGYGTITGQLARDLIESCPTDAGPQVRRIFTAPGSGELVGMESRSRTYDGLLRQFIRLRDQRCRTPYCESAIKQIDHIRSVATGGRTTAGSGRAACEHCNYSKELPGYRVTGTAEHSAYTIAGVTVHSRPPAPPRTLHRRL